MYLFLWQVVTLHAEASSRSCTYDIFCISGGKVKAGENAFYHDIIHIPPLPPSRLEGCSIIDVNYVIRVTMQPSLENAAHNDYVAFGILHLNCWKTHHSWIT